MTTYRNALQAMLEGKGYEVTVVDGNNDQAKQTEQVNTFITQGVDALIINPVMTSAADTIIAAVQQADVPTVLINREPTAEQMAAYNKLVTLVVMLHSPVPSRAKSFWKPRTRETSTATAKFLTS